MNNHLSKKTLSTDFAEQSVAQFISELASLDMDSCELSYLEKVRRVLKYYLDETISECADITGKKEEIESRCLFFLRSLHEIGDLDSDYRFIDSILNDFLDYSFFERGFKNKTKAYIEALINHKDNPNHIGSVFYSQYLNGLNACHGIKKRVLWLCNIVIPEFAGAYGMKPRPYAGWISGMLSEVEKREDIDVALVFPIYNPNRMRDGYCKRHRFYSLLSDSRDTYSVSEKHIRRFEEILELYSPDVVHIWGTEFAWSLEMVMACEKMNCIDRVIVSIQGLVHICARHYLSGMPDYACAFKEEGNNSLIEDKSVFEKRGENEKALLKKISCVFGRTDWDKSCCLAINPNLEYHFGRDILRGTFYQNIGTWRFDSCEKGRIFFSQAWYPLKGFHMLLEAMPIILRECPECEVFVGGADMISGNLLTPYGNYLKDLIEKNSIETKIHFLGNLSEEEMVYQYQKANLFISASSIENSSNSVCEAKLIGTPVVTSFVGGVPSHVSHGKDGYMYPQTDPEMLAYYTIKLLKDRVMCEFFSRNGIRSAKEYVSRDNAVNDLIAGYNSIVEIKLI